MRKVDAAVKSPILNLNIHFATTVHPSNLHYSSRYRGTPQNSRILTVAGEALPYHSLTGTTEVGLREGLYSRSYVFEGYDKSPWPIKLTGDSVVPSSTTLLLFRWRRRCGLARNRTPGALHILI